jgi:hypothetical protein
MVVKKIRGSCMKKVIFFLILLLAGCGTIPLQFDSLENPKYNDACFPKVMVVSTNHGLNSRNKMENNLIAALEENDVKSQFVSENTFFFQDSMPSWDKIRKIATKEKCAGFLIINFSNVQNHSVHVPGIITTSGKATHNFDGSYTYSSETYDNSFDINYFTVNAKAEIVNVQNNELVFNTECVLSNGGELSFEALTQDYFKQLSEVLVNNGFFDAPL